MQGLVDALSCVRPWHHRREPPRGALHRLPALLLLLLASVVNVRHYLRVGRLGHAAVREHRRGLVLNDQLNRLGNLGAVELCRQPQRHVEAGSDARRGDTVPIDYHPLANRRRTEGDQELEREPVGGGLEAAQQSRCTEEERARANRHLR